jgi:hypothetical protein
MQLSVIDREPLASHVRAARIAGLGPDALRNDLESVGWPENVARAAADRLVKGVDHPVVWWARYGGLSAVVLSLATAAHLALAAAEGGNLTAGLGQSVASAFTVATVALPVALWGRHMTRTLSTGPGRWSRTRRTLLDVMMWATAIVAIMRALVYVYAVFQSIFVATAAPLSVWAFMQVAVTIVAAGSMFVFAWRERLDARSGQLSPQ